MTVIFFISFLAETNRPPFDSARGRSEIVAGYRDGIFLDRVPSSSCLAEYFEHRPDVRA